MKITVVRDQITPDLQELTRDLQRIPEDAFKIFRSHTPIRSGAARRNTTLKGSTIDANYAYATALDGGSSNQAPDGMTKPTLDLVRRRLDRLFKGR